MARVAYALLCAALALSLFDQSFARRGFSGRGGSHSYPSSRGGLSGGGGSHSYPHSTGLSGNSGGVSRTHVNPSQSGYPSGGLSGSSHGYPSSGGLSGNSRGYPNNPSSGSNYPSGGLSGSNTHHSNNHGYPASNGLSGSSYPNNVYKAPTHSVYNPPQQIRYTPPGGQTTHYPVYHGTPPNYVYQYKDSGSKYGGLLAGLALMNLGVLGASVYAATKTHNSEPYKTKPGEQCRFGLKKPNGDYEETIINCQLISSFILAEEAKALNATLNANATSTTEPTSTISTTVSTTIANNETVAEVTTPAYTMLENGTLVPSNGTAGNATEVAHDPPPVATNITATTVPANTTHAVDALESKGPPIEVTPGLKCYVIRISPTSNMRKTVDCGLLQSYNESSLKSQPAKPNVATRLAPVFTILSAAIAYCMI